MSDEPLHPRAIFNEAVERVPAERWPDFLDEACGEDHTLREKVQRLLDAHGAIGGFMDKPAAAPVATLGQPISEKPGTQIGPYKLLQQIGDGGMGVVYMAEQTEPVERRVALKIIKPGMDTQQVIARFEAERQALAMMDHPNIARVLDASTTDSGRPYFVMELVKGIQITQYCDEHRLSPRERMELFVPVCQAVQHAHQKGIIHRDIKPSNVLVAEYDDRAVPKIIDFGVAKAMDRRLTERTIFTQFGQVVGTIDYMSPEQAKLNQLDIDTRSDIYSLGVLLYELLTGETPFDRERLRLAAFDELLRIVREEDPPKPSLRLSTSDSLPSIAANRQSEPKKLSTFVRGELDWIVMKALEKDRTRRYETANGFASDIRRFLSDEPVEACPPSTAYRLKKFVRRNKAGLATTSVMFLGVLVAVVALVVSNVRIKAEQEQTMEALSRENEANENLRTSLARERRTLYFHRIALAHRELAANYVRRAKKHLEACPASLRDWEWNHLEWMSDRSVRTLKGHTHRVYGLSVRPDGKRIASGSWDGTVRIWDAETGKLVRESPARLDSSGEVDAVWSIDYSPDGKRIAVGTWKAIHLWNPGTEEIELEIDILAESGVIAVEFSPDGQRVASVTDGSDAVDVWDSSTGERALELRGHTDSVRCLAYSPGGKWILSGSGDRTMTLWDAGTGEPVRTFRGHELGVASVAFDADASRIVSGGWDHTVRVWNVKAGRLELTISGHDHWVGGVTFHPDGTQVVSACADNSCKVWDAESGNELLTLRGHEAPCAAVAVDPSGTWIVSGSWDGTLKMWDVTSRDQVPGFHGHHSLIKSVAFSPDGKRIASGSHDDTIRLWNTLTGREEMALTEHANDVNSLAFTSNGRWLVSASADHTLRFWEARTGQSVGTLAHPDEVLAVASIPTGNLVVSGCGDHKARVWDLPDGRLLTTLTGHTAPVVSVACSPDGRLVATGSEDHSCRVWDVRTGSELQVFRGHVGAVNSLAFSPTGNEIVSCCMFTDEHRGGNVKFWDPSTGEELPVRLQTNPGPCRTVAFSPSGNRIVVASLSGFIVLFDSATGEEALALRAHKSEAACAVFDGKGQRIASGGYDTVLKLWETSQCD